MKLATIGYERDTVEGVIARLKGARIEVLVDVRAVTSSRRPGFSKRQLAAHLADAGIDYVHLRALGTPSAGRTAARAGRTSEMRAIYEKHLKEVEARAEFSELTQIAERRRACLLCYEADVAQCHRAILAERLHTQTGCKILDL
jgi:uncharacterized protein (DUF488 family)